MTFKEAVEDVLFSQEDYFRIKRGVDFMHEQYSKETGINAGNLTNERLIETSNGLVVTPMQAAHCLVDLMRTTRFLRGIYQAIIDYQEAKSGPVRILYAGCGPYATLLTPFTQLFSAEQVSFTMLDINTESTNAMRTLYENWGLSEYIESIIVADATAPDIDLEGNFEIIISETMQVILKNECQVPITRNLVRFLTNDGTFIPQNITVDAYFEGKQHTLEPEKTETLFVGNVYDLDFKDIPKIGHQATLDMPSTEFEYLYLYTQIRIYKDEIIKPFESGLTLPLISDRFEKKPKAITYKYEEGKKPGFVKEYHM